MTDIGAQVYFVLVIAAERAAHVNIRIQLIHSSDNLFAADQLLQIEPAITMRNYR